MKWNRPPDQKQTISPLTNCDKRQQQQPPNSYTSGYIWGTLLLCLARVLSDRLPNSYTAKNGGSKLGRRIVDHVRPEEFIILFATAFPAPLRTVVSRSLGLWNEWFQCIDQFRPAVANVLGVRFDVNHSGLILCVIGFDQ
jgi:hypothetical protein